jgi:8-oxo-dGTP diphosphatase
VECGADVDLQVPLALPIVDFTISNATMKRAIDVAAAIIRRENSVFVTRRGPNEKMATLWEFPGGKLEANESPQDCIVRELAEELSILASAGKVLLESSHDYPDVTVNLIAVEVEMLGDQFELTVHDEAKWVEIGALLELNLAPADIPIAEALMPRLEVAGD